MNSSISTLNKLVLATGNLGKLHEMQALLQSLNIEVLPQSDFNVPECPEPHCTFIENALAKARHASRITGLAALADDSGLCVAALQGSPGVLSARYACENEHDKKSDAANNAKLLKVLINEENRHAYYYCVMVLVRYADDPQPLISEGVWTGEIRREARGEGGFGYDPLFLDDITGQTVAELSPAIKNRISHRGQAMHKLLLKLENMQNG